MLVSLVGGTGFVGSYIVDALLAQGHTPRLLVRPGSAAKLQRSAECQTVEGDIRDLAALDALLQDAAAVIYLVGILREFPARGITFEETQFQGVERTLAAAQRQGVQHFVLMSANGVKADGTPYQAIKWRAEQAVMQSGLAYTIFRPSVIFGDPRGKMEFCTQLLHELVRPPIPAPLFFAGLNPLAAGQFQLAPVHVQDVAAAFVAALGNPAAQGKVFPLCGPTAMTWREIIQTLAQASGRSGKLALPAPVLPIKLLASLLDRQPWFPITRDQLTMLLEGNTCTDHTAWQVFGITPQRFAVENLAYLQQRG